MTRMDRERGWCFAVVTFLVAANLIGYHLLLERWDQLQTTNALVAMHPHI